MSLNMNEVHMLLYYTIIYEKINFEKNKKLLSQKKL